MTIWSALLFMIKKLFIYNYKRFTFIKVSMCISTEKRLPKHLEMKHEGKQKHDKKLYAVQNQSYTGYDEKVRNRTKVNGSYLHRISI